MSSTLERSLQKAFGAVSPHVPLSVKRPIKRAIPKRYHRYVDPEWHRWAIGGMWDALGELQFKYLIDRGLKPEHTLLDVGCGPLRGGIRFIEYLEPGNYTGVEKDWRKLEAGRDVELPAHGLVDKRPQLVVMENFDFPSLGRGFDYAIAQSVFTHLPINQIIRCVVQMSRVLNPGGQFFATFYENKDGKQNLDPVEQKPGLLTHFDQDFFHYDYGTFEWVADGTGLEVEHLGEWDNPRNQRMLVFRKPAA
ncbi:MAG TPA: class I SAM-dependent methyltransferase [Gaiellaceae bacterium]|jgi:SAM-dependent methyltransferase